MKTHKDYLKLFQKLHWEIMDKREADNSVSASPSLYKEYGKGLEMVNLALDSLSLIEQNLVAKEYASWGGYQRARFGTGMGVPRIK